MEPERTYLTQQRRQLPLPSTNSRLSCRDLQQHAQNTTAHALIYVRVRTNYICEHDEVNISTTHSNVQLGSKAPNARASNSQSASNQSATGECPTYIPTPPSLDFNQAIGSSEARSAGGGCPSRALRTVALTGMCPRSGARGSPSTKCQTTRSGGQPG